MKIAIISDIHDRPDNLDWAFKQIKQSDSEQIFCLGDLTSGYIAQMLAHAPRPVFCVLGNNDGDKITITKNSMKKDSTLTLANRDFAEYITGNKKYYLTHYPELAHLAALSQQYDAVFHGHTHVKKHEVINNTHIINPGEIAGYRSGIVSFAIFDTLKKEVLFKEKK